LAINYLLDAGPLVGLFDAADQWHSWSRGALGAIEERMATTETALAEACHHLRRTRSALRDIMLMLAEGRVVLVSILNENPQRIGELLEQYPEMDVGDATLVVLSEVFPRAKLVTIDRRDFSIYRRRDGHAVPTIMP
jgi:predicted nucleic acid-binding protein